MINLWPMLLPAAAWSGWWVATRNYSDKKRNSENRLSREYVVGLNYLLNEQPDKAVDVFIKLLEVDSETVETHLALGSLFRRRGEVDRAIRIHQNLIARPQLSLLQRKEALMALGQDYMSAGVFDRAERIFLEVVEIGGSKETGSLYELLAIYQQEKAWEKALDIIKKLEISTGNSLHHQAAHYYCEMANEALKDKAYDRAYYCVKHALTVDRESVRGSLMLANMEIQAGRFKQAIKILKKVPQQDPDFITEIIQPLVLCYKEINCMSECVNYLKQILIDHPRASVIFVIADYLRLEKNLDTAIDFVAENLSKYPSIRGLNRLIYWHLDSAYGKVRDKLQMLYDITSKFLDNKPIYRCGHCGFGGKHLHWHCPSCKQWGKMKPIHGLEGG
ncbi:lipopolysaccharide assembly protein LapB [Legionella israelensis]|uniref:Lipopolysaccharide assembly protein B n=1 Tax=Legionella israelensis TaxID=454 RepID=A0A0W0VRB0_9GAMM|nr:lipopolysaccharide assembly protein LapB [Legionella israelensis]KTD22708.1 tetratricopeptide repeat protein [Legionella israelensis]QBS08497.1 lipopolysaccharide assembly protein LapB [Legionella israelensis]SCY44202.1 Lipopolysaccharide biosynthesis regulator YciM, contains six TPR domains and a predicted metal-binding C-terminal domain [Legionella israelensis DSM 19235]STX58145.1 TPR domain protein (heat shock protein) [Legionella israelensis]